MSAESSSPSEAWLPSDGDGLMDRLQCGYLVRVCQFGRGLAFLFEKGNPNSAQSIRYETVDRLIATDVLELIEEGWYHGVYRLNRKQAEAATG